MKLSFLSILLVTFFFIPNAKAEIEAKVLLENTIYKQLKFSSRPELRKDDKVRALLEDSPVEGIDQDLVIRIFNYLPNTRFDATGRFLNIFLDSSKMNDFRKGYTLNFSSQVERKDDVEITFEAYKSKNEKNKQRYFRNNRFTNAEGSLKVLEFEESTREVTFLLQAEIIGYDVIQAGQENLGILNPVMNLRSKITCILPELN